MNWDISNRTLKKEIEYQSEYIQFQLRTAGKAFYMYIAFEKYCKNIQQIVWNQLKTTYILRQTYW